MLTALGAILPELSNTSFYLLASCSFHDFVLKIFADIVMVVEADRGLLLQCVSSAELMGLEQKESYGEFERSLRQPLERGH